MTGRKKSPADNCDKIEQESSLGLPHSLQMFILANVVLAIVIKSTDSLPLQPWYARILSTGQTKNMSSFGSKRKARNIGADLNDDAEISGTFPSRVPCPLVSLITIPRTQS